MHTSSPLATLTSSSYAGIFLLLSVLLLAIGVSRDWISLAPRWVKLPGPIGLPLVGNLFRWLADNQFQNRCQNCLFKFYSDRHWVTFHKLRYWGIFPSFAEAAVGTYHFGGTKGDKARGGLEISFGLAKRLSPGGESSCDSPILRVALAALGFARSMIAWVLAFLDGHRVMVVVNGDAPGHEQLCPAAVGAVHDATFLICINRLLLRHPVPLLNRTHMHGAFLFLSSAGPTCNDPAQAGVPMREDGCAGDLWLSLKDQPLASSTSYKRASDFF
ncbi:hypothetical protein DFH08DRAFT_801558 [Mycena albidolilacea]|uniref:Uncharacterized protein n=1 Tax=Mycena albidolilacea TaxID=1033008 RepID=A0AAD7AIW6_9AGAR|nr:hypothetical protein DFH08DRAFT_801558 [Mycena albidolilacea]